MIKQKYYNTYCEHCGHKEEATKFDVFKNRIFYISLSLIIICTFLFLIIITTIGPNNLISMLVTEDLTSQLSNDNDYFRDIALQYTTFDGYDSFGFTEDLVEHLPRIRYVDNGEKQIISPKDVLQKGGDCKSQSIFLVSLMKSTGYSAYIDCNIKYRHCVTKIPYQNQCTMCNRL